MIQIFADNSVQERENKIVKELKEARPAIIVSCSDGILIATFNDLHKPKIKQVSGPIAFVGVGIWGDFNRLWQFAASSLIGYRFVIASERDFSIFDKIIETLCMEIRQKFCNLYSTDYYQCELVFAFLGKDKPLDRLYLIDCAGIEKSNSSYFIIPTSGIIIPNVSALEESKTMKEVLPLVVDILRNGKEPNLDNLEVAVLSRNILLEGNLEGAYRKLSVEEARGWLSD